MSTFFDHKSIVVIGASGVLGAELSRNLLAQGATVHVVVRTPGNLDPEFSALPSAQAEIENRETLAKALDELGGSFDGLINAAGVVAFGSLADVPSEVVAQLFATNAQGTVNLLSLAGTHVKEGGFVASLTGVAADVDVLGMSAYCASKAAAKKAMSIGARELRSKKITVLDVRAPHTETGLVNRALFGEAPKMPQGLSPQQVAARILQAVESGEKDLPADAFSA
jgi:NAD(P)-dependent dehydrogenase (short-subunit alcohol dehydrogenase family)